MNVLTEQSTLEDLAVLLAHAKGRSFKMSARGGIYIVALHYPGGTAQLANESLSGALNGAVMLLGAVSAGPLLDSGPTETDTQLADPEVTPDPTGTRIGVAPPPDGELGS